MIITKEHIFLHIPKTGGQSVARAYKAKYGIDNDIHNINQITGERLPNPHMRASEVRKMVGDEVYKNAIKFAIVRNPFDRMVSFYHYGQKKLINGVFNSFYEFIKYTCSNDYNSKIGLWNNAKVTQREYLDDDVNFITKFDKSGVNTIFNMLELGEVLHVNKSVHDDYLNYYNEDTMELVLDYFAEDFKRFYS